MPRFAVRRAAVALVKDGKAGLLPPDGRQGETALDVRRGVCRLLSAENCGCSPPSAPAARASAA